MNTSPADVLDFTFLPIFEIVTLVLTCLKTVNMYRILRSQYIGAHGGIIYFLLYNGKS
jgi:hypothetical protein